MALKDLVLNLVTDHIGGTLAVEEESGNIVYADSCFDKGYGRNPEGEAAEDAFFWLGDCPVIADGEEVTDENGETVTEYVTVLSTETTGESSTVSETQTDENEEE